MKPLHVLVHLILTITLGGRAYYYPHFPDGKLRLRKVKRLAHTVKSESSDSIPASWFGTKLTYCL